MIIKFLLFILISLISLFPCFSAESVDPSIKAEIKQTVQLKADSTLSKFDIGFSKKPVLTWNSQPTRYGAESVKLTPIVNPNGSNYAIIDPSNELYVYWRLYSLQQVEIKLRAKGAMINSVNNQKKLPWTVSWTYEGKLMTSYGSGTVLPDAAPANSKKYQPVVLCKKLITLQGIAGSTKLDIHTNSLLDTRVKYNVVEDKLEPAKTDNKETPCITNGVYTGYLELLIQVT